MKTDYFQEPSERDDFLGTSEQQIVCLFGFLPCHVEQAVAAWINANFVNYHKTKSVLLSVLILLHVSDSVLSAFLSLLGHDLQIRRFGNAHPPSLW